MLHTEEEFVPTLDEGAFLLMPTTMQHAGMQANENYLRLLDMAVASIPEIETVVGKAGRIESALDPAPMSMFENIIFYKPEYKIDEKGRRIRFRFENGNYVRDENGELIPDKNGRYFRQWRSHIQSKEDIWNEIVKTTNIPGLTSAPKLHPIETRIIMLQTGMRAPMGIKVKGNDLKKIEEFGLVLEKELKKVEGVKEATVFSDRIIGKPYLIIKVLRNEIARYGLFLEDVQNQIQAAVGGMNVSKTVEGRERYDIIVRYPRELRNSPYEIENILISNDTGVQIPLKNIVKISYEQGPQSIKSEDGFLISYVLFDKEDGVSEIEVVERAQKMLNDKINKGEITPPAGVSFEFAGNYQQQQRANQRLKIIIPISLILIFIVLYFQFKSIPLSIIIFLGVLISFSGGFMMIALYNQDWFLNFSIFGSNLRDIFQISTINLSVAVWVGFLALFGIATDDGVLVGTFLKQQFEKNKPQTKEEIKQSIILAGKRRVRPAMMTTATTILALLPVLSSSGKGAEIMIPMAIPSFGGMFINVITIFTVPLLYYFLQLFQLKFKRHEK